MTDQTEIRPGDRVMLRGSDPPKTGKVIDVLLRSAEFRQDRPSSRDRGSIPDDLAWVWWKGEPKPVTERAADLIKLTEGNDQQ